MDNLGYLLAVFGIAWLVLFAYVLILINNQKKLQKSIQTLKEELQKAESKSGLKN
jgi:CcmD family protein